MDVYTSEGRANLADPLDGSPTHGSESSPDMRNNSTGGERVPLKTVLQNFLNHVDDLEARRREGDDAYDKEFQVCFSFILT